jgi:hypothetical protein
LCTDLLIQCPDTHSTVPVWCLLGCWLVWSPRCLRNSRLHEFDSPTPLPTTRSPVRNAHHLRGRPDVRFVSGAPLDQ